MLCGSHIRNDEIHVTPSDKEAWNTPFSTGYFLGNGSSSRSVAIGFKPRVLILFCMDSPIINIDFSASAAQSQFAVAYEGYSSHGLAITSTGFRVSKSTINSVSSALTQVGSSYCYIALK